MAGSRHDTTKNSAWGTIPSARDSLTTRDRRALACAQLTQEGLTQQDIATELDVSQAEVSKLLKHARQAGWLVWTVNWPSDLSDEDRRSLIGPRGYPRLAELRERIDDWLIGNSLTGFSPLKEIHVIQKPPHSSEDPLSFFGSRAADVIVRLIAEATTCAVAWGRTVQSIVDAIPAQKPGKQREFFPICGEPLNFPNFSLSPSVAAIKLAKAYRVEPSRVVSLQGVPARVPSDLASGMDVIEQFARKSRAYDYVFGSETPTDNPRIAEVDMVLTGVSNDESSVGDPWYEETRECEEGIDLGRISVGCIGGLWLPKTTSTRADRHKLDEVNSRWLGISMNHLKLIARRAMRTASPGVVVVAAHRYKWEIVKMALPLVNHLVISDELADAILETRSLPPFRA